MNQEIHFKGLSLTPDDHHTQPGELSLCANTELHNGALRPSVINGTAVANSLKIGNFVATLLYVHTVSNYKYYIASALVNGSLGLYWFNSDGTHAEDNLIYTFGEVPKSITSVGNTLVILTSTGIHYAKLSEGVYTYIGSKIPELPLTFALHLEGVEESETVTLDMYSSSGWGGMDSGTPPDVNDDDVATVTDTVLGAVNKFIHEQHYKGRFMFPFFVRYAYKLYDGTLSMHSAPILMPCGYGTPYAIVPNPNVESGYASRLNADFNVFAPTFSLRAVLLENSGISVKTQLEKWSDIITGVDVFISQPLYRYDASGQVKTLVNIGTRDGSVVHHYAPFHDAYSVRNANDGTYSYKLYAGDSLNHGDCWDQWNTYQWLLKLPLKSDDAYKDMVRNCGEFFFLKSLKISELALDPGNITIEDGYLNNIVTQTKMTDDYDSHDTIIPGGAYMYNNRVSVIDIEKKLFDGYRPQAQYVYGNDGRPPKTIYYYIEQDGRKIKVTANETHFGNRVPTPYVFYPNTKAYMAILNNKKVILEPHPTLNGAVYFESLSETSPGDTLDGHENDGVSTDNTIMVPNKIYTSEINNPYYFPLEGINTVGVGSIIGLAGITRALSPGQLGIYKVMAFCSDGIWALTVGSTGTFADSSRISFDVCINKDSICQLGQSVIFATKGGLSMVTESDVESISKQLDGPLYSIENNLPSLIEETLVQRTDDYGHPLYVCAVEQTTGVLVYTLDGGETWYQYQTEVAVIPDNTPKPVMVDGPYTPLMRVSSHPFDFFADALVLYDFANARVMVLSKTSRLAYIYSLKDAAWSTMYLSEQPLKVVVSYPFPYLQNNDGSLLCIDKNYNYSDNISISSFILTRSLSYSSVMQVIQAYQQIHDCPAGQPQLLFIYGSNDNVNWEYVGKSNRNHISYLPGHPYRYFRIALILDMKPRNTYSKLLLDIVEKYQKL